MSTSGNSYTASTQEEAIIKAMVELCKPCCDNGDWNGTYTDCRCAYPWEFNEADPVPPPQPAGGFFPTVVYYEADFTGDCNNCFTTDVCPCYYTDAPLFNPEFPYASVVSSTVVSYCSGKKRIPLRACFPALFPTSYSNIIPICDVTFTVSSGFGFYYTFTIRKWMKLGLDVTCSSCVVIDYEMVADRGWPEEWIGLEYCSPATFTFAADMFWSPVTVPETDGFILGTSSQPCNGGHRVAGGGFPVALPIFVGPVDDACDAFYNSFDGVNYPPDLGCPVNQSENGPNLAIVAASGPLAGTLSGWTNIRLYGGNGFNASGTLACCDTKSLTATNTDPWLGECCLPDNPILVLPGCDS